MPSRAVITPVFALLLAACTGSGRSTTCDTGLAAAQSQLASCQSDLSTCQTSDSGCATDLAAAQGDLSACQDGLDTAQGDLSACQDGLDTAQGDLSTCQDSLGTMQSTLSSTQSDLATANAEIDALTASDADLTAAITADSVHFDWNVDYGVLSSFTFAGDGSYVEKVSILTYDSGNGIIYAGTPYDDPGTWTVSGNVVTVTETTWGTIRHLEAIRASGGKVNLVDHANRRYYHQQ